MQQGLNDLSLSFLNSGKNKLIVSQWAVSSDETSKLISYYFENTYKNNLKEDSLKESMINIFKKKTSKVLGTFSYS